MKLASLVGAIAAGCIGAIVWALISYYANMEVGYVAWGIGLLVGYSAHTFGAQGMAAGLFCAVVALASMLGGKAVAHQMEIDGAIEQEILPEAYAYTKTDAAAFAELESPEATAKFMVDFDYTGAETADEVGEDELESFQANTVPHLKAFQSTDPTYEQWLESNQAQELDAAVRSQTSLIEGVKQSLGPVDVIFGLLGLSTAFKMGSAPQESEGEPIVESEANISE